MFPYIGQSVTFKVVLLFGAHGSLVDISVTILHFFKIMIAGSGDVY